MHTQYSANEDPIGCGLVGCLGGLFFGLVGGALLLIVAALVSATTAPEPTLAAAAQPGPDLRLSLTEDFLNRFIEQPPDGRVTLDIVPGSQIHISADTTVDGFGVAVPVTITGIFLVQLNGQALEVSLLDTRVAGLTLPPDLSNIFSADVPVINQELNHMVSQMSDALGTPVVITALSTDDTQILLEARELQ